MPYLFGHFKEKITPDGEQVYIALSKNGLDWESVNGGEPILTSTIGEKGCRDIEIVRMKDGSFVILTTDLSIAYRMDENYQVNWKEVNSTGSKCLCMWKTDDMINFSEQKRIYFGRDDFGCLWAPEVFYDEINDEYMIHWGSTVKEDNFAHMSIYCCTTRDFETFSEPKLFFTKDNEILDTHIRKIGDTYHMFYKDCLEPSKNLHATAESLYGPYKNDESFAEYMSTLDKPWAYEAPTTLTLPDGRWCLMIDFFGCAKEEMGYVPFISEKPGDCNFRRDEESFSFPYGFKHGGIVEISDEEYYKIKNHYN